MIRQKNEESVGFQVSYLHMNLHYIDHRKMMDKELSINGNGKMLQVAVKNCQLCAEYRELTITVCL